MLHDARAPQQDFLLKVSGCAAAHCGQALADRTGATLKTAARLSLAEIE